MQRISLKTGAFSFPTLVLLITWQPCRSQEFKSRPREVTVYNVVAHTTKGKVKGVFERNTGDRIFITTKKGEYVAINVTELEKRKVKDRPKKRVLRPFDYMRPTSDDYNPNGTLTQNYLDPNGARLQLPLAISPSGGPKLHQLLAMSHSR